MDFNDECMWVTNEFDSWLIVLSIIVLYAVKT